MPGAKGQAALLSGEGTESLWGPNCSKAQGQGGRRTFVKSFGPGEDQTGAEMVLGPPPCQSPELCPWCWPRRWTGNAGRTDPELGRGLLSHPPRHYRGTSQCMGRWAGRCSQPRGVTWGGETMGQGTFGPGSATASCDKKTPPAPSPMSWPQGAAEEGKGFHWDPWDLGFSPKPSVGNGDNNCVVST